MAGVAMNLTGPGHVAFDARELIAAVARMEEFGLDPNELLRRWGTYWVGEVKREFQAAEWPDKPPHWEYWEGGPGKNLKDNPLTYKGKLASSIVYDIGGGRLRVGSALEYAATHQFGEAEIRSFYVWIRPDLDGEGHVQYFEGTGYPKGRLVPEGTEGAMKVLVHQRVIARPFLKPPTPAQQLELVDIAHRVIERRINMGRAS